MSSSHNPLEQFSIHYYTNAPDIFGFNLNISNSTVFMIASTIAVAILMSLGAGKRALVPGRLQGLVEVLYEMVAATVRDNVGNEGREYFPFIFTVFMFVLSCNLMGMMPYSFAVTSHIAVTFALAAFIFIAVTIIAIVKHGTKFFGFFLPHGTPWWIAPLMVFIEIFSYLARPCSLSIRLAANMMAGHIMLKVVAGFVIALGVYFGWAPMAFLVIFSAFEVFVAILQAYIFTVLSCIYLNEALHLH